MKAFFALYFEGFTWLKRDKVFGPILLVGLGISLFANSASQWSIEDFSKILFDIGIAGFRLTGGMVAILWGSRMIHDALNERSLDPRIAAPISRSTWYLAKFFALASALVVMGVIFAIWWQALMYFNHFGIMSNLQSWSLAMLTCEWIVLAALSMLMASFTGFGMALFSTTSLWIAGLLAPLVAATKDPNLPQAQSNLLDGIASIWNFQRFNLVDQLSNTNGIIEWHDLTSRLIWSTSLAIGLLTAGIWRFSERDLS